MSLRRVLLGRSPGRTLLRAGLVTLLLLLGSRYVLSPVRAVGISMLPTIADGEWLLLNRLAYRVAGPERGDVVAILMAGSRAVLVKRVIALPGERVRIEAGAVFVDDVHLDEPYVHYRLGWNVEEVALTPDQFYVVGDNRSMTAGNHDFGVTERPRVIGRIRRVNAIARPDIRSR
jgi:signal peptidase I